MEQKKNNPKYELNEQICPTQLSLQYRQEVIRKQTSKKQRKNKPRPGPSVLSQEATDPPHHLQPQ